MRQRRRDRGKKKLGTSPFLVTSVSAALKIFALFSSVLFLSVRGARGITYPAMSIGGLRSLSMEHFNLTAESAEINMDKALTALAATVGDLEERKKFDAEMKGLRMIFKRYMESKGEKIDWAKIKAPSDDLILPHHTLPECSPKNVKHLASKLAVLKLNGGLGTTMGCVGPKSVIEVREGQSFLDLTVKQIKVRFPFLHFLLRFDNIRPLSCLLYGHI
jgi:hypothetical protein